MQQAQGAASAAQAPPLAGRIGPRANSLRLLYHIPATERNAVFAFPAGIPHLRILNWKERELSWI